jgi:GTP cyclohydrolase IA
MSDDFAAVAAAAALMDALGLERRTVGTAETPRRFAGALRELTEATHADPSDVLERTFPPEVAGDDPGMVAVVDIPFVSVCEHHLLPFTGTATVAYLPSPGAELVGLSKIPRLVLALARRPQVQERLGAQIVESLCSRLRVDGAAAVLKAQHSCMALRGVRADAHMITSHLRGAFKDDPAVRAEFLALRG